jgi:hypothetical protein
VRKANSFRDGVWCIRVLVECSGLVVCNLRKSSPVVIVWKCAPFTVEITIDTHCCEQVLAYCYCVGNSEFSVGIILALYNGKTHKCWPIVIVWEIQEFSVGIILALYNGKTHKCWPIVIVWEIQELVCE